MEKMGSGEIIGIKGVKDEKNIFCFMNLDERNIEVLDEKMAEVFRMKTHQERLLIAFKMWDFAKKHLSDYLRLKYPDRDEGKIFREVVRRLSHGTI